MAHIETAITADRVITVGRACRGLIAPRLDFSSVISHRHINVGVLKTRLFEIYLWLQVRAALNCCKMYKHIIDIEKCSTFVF